MGFDCSTQQPTLETFGDIYWTDTHYTDDSWPLKGVTLEAKKSDGEGAQRPNQTKAVCPARITSMSKCVVPGLVVWVLKCALDAPSRAPYCTLAVLLNPTLKPKTPKRSD